MSKSCNCSAVVFGNTGESACKKIQDVARHIGLTFTKDANGATKSYTTSEIASFNGVNGMKSLIDASLPTDRIYWLTELENVTNLREDSVFQTFNSGRQAKVRDGFKNFTGMLVNAPYAMLQEIKALACKNLSALVMDKSDNLVGYDGGDKTTINPIKINTDSFDAVYVEPTETEVGGIMIKFQWSLSQSDESWRMIKSSDLDYGSDDLYGLLTVELTVSSLSTTGVTLELCTVYDEPVQGLLVGDFTLYNNTDAAAVSIASLSETSAGVYELTWLAQDSGDELALTLTKEFYDASLVNATVLTTP